MSSITGLEARDGTRLDPYKAYKFVIMMDKKEVAGVSKVGPLKRTTEVITYSEGGKNDRDTKIPGRTSYEGMILERGMTDDEDFKKWAFLIHPVSDTGRSFDYKKDLQLIIRNERNEARLTYNLYGCWVSEYTISELDSGSNNLMIETIKIEIDRWERDSG